MAKKISQYQDGVPNENVRLLGTDPQQGNNTLNYLLKDLALSETLLPSVLNFFDFSSGSTTTSTQGNWTPLICTTTQGYKRNGLSLVEDINQDTSTLVEYVSEPTKKFRVSYISSLFAASGRRIHLAIFKNGNLWPCSEFAVTVPPSAGEITIPGHCVVELAQNDTIEIYIKCSSHALSATIDNINVIIEQY
jgi:hypothetical protein